MNFKKINWGLSTVVLLMLVSFFWTQWNKFEDDNFKYGKDFNLIRDSLGIPKIEENWITHESSPTFRFWAHPGRVLYTIDPIHFNKESELEDGKLKSERDCFHYETNDSLAYRVIYKYDYNDLVWNCKFIKYRKRKYPLTESWELTLEQADSAINSWGLRRHGLQQKL